MPKNAHPAFVATQGQLADALNVDRKTVGRWLKIPGNPGKRANGKYPVNAWMTWAAAQSRKAIGSGMTALKEKLLAAQIRRLEHHTNVSMRLHVPAAEVEAMGARLGTNIRKIVCQIHLKAPTLAMRPVEYVEAELIRLEDELIGQLHALAEDLDRMKEGTLEASQEAADLDTPTLPPGKESF